MGKNRGVERDTASSRGSCSSACLVLAVYLTGALALGVRPRHRGDGRLVPGGRSRRASPCWWRPGADWPLVLAAVTVAFALANVTVGRSLGVATLLGVADSVEVALVATLVVRFIGRRMRDVQDAWRLFAIAAAGAITAGVLISLVYWRCWTAPSGAPSAWSFPRTAPRSSC